MSDFSETWKAMSVADPDIAIRLREADGGYFMRKMFTEAAEEIERLRAERDEARRERDSARRMYCCEMAHDGNSPADVAEALGWEIARKDDK